jgi:hypothetical protein
MTRVARFGLFTLLGVCPLAWGSWGNFKSTGSATGIGNPSCAHVSTGHVACAVRSSQSAIMSTSSMVQRGERGRAWPGRSVLIRVAPAMEPARCAAPRLQPMGPPGNGPQRWGMEHPNPGDGGAIRRPAVRSHQSYTAINTRFLRPDVAAVDVHWEMTGATDAQGNPRPGRRGLLSFWRRTPGGGRSW